MGTIEIYIGPNGFGKTKKLESIRDDLIATGGATNDSILFLDSEVALSGEMKDTVDTSKTMEFILFELLQTPRYMELRKELEEEIDRLVTGGQVKMDTLVDEILSMNGSARKDHFIKPTKPEKKVIKGQVSIDSKVVRDYMGSGQKMQLLLSMVLESSKEFIFLDEPERYSHPSLLNRTAHIINQLVGKGKSVYLATHSPKLLSMIDFAFEDLYVINDATHTAKPIDFDGVLTKTKGLPVTNYPTISKAYYKDAASLAAAIKKRHFRDFLEALFAKRVYVCEGINDALYINASLQQFGKTFEEYHILKTYGKFHVPVIAELLASIGTEVVVMHDVDNEALNQHKETNDYLGSQFAKVLRMDPNLEDEIGYSGKKNDTLDYLEYLDSLGTLRNVWL